MKNKLIKIIKIPRIEDDCYLCFAENNKHIPFKIKRIFYIGLPVLGLSRGKHAHRKNKQVLFCIQGKVRMVLDNGKDREEVILDRPETGLFLDKMVWHEMCDMDEKTILLVLASDFYDEKDYIRNYKKFLQVTNRK